VRASKELGPFIDITVGTVLLAWLWCCQT